jgi:DNA mismatch repair protein MutL
VRPFLFPFAAKTELITMTGHVVAPLETRRDLAGVHIAVNARPVSDRGLVQAVRTAFRTLLEVGRQPILAVNIAIDPEFVDVNVHPRKAEVRFADPRRVHGHLIALLSEFLSKTPWLQGNAATKRVVIAPLSFTTPQTNPLADEHRDRVRAAMEKLNAAVPSRQPEVFTSAGTGGAQSFSSLRVVGQVGGTYLVLEGPSGMVVIDQHAAHERVVFERLRAQRAMAEAPSQPLLLPIQLDLSATERAALDDDNARALLSRHGLVVEPFGPHTAMVKALPPGLDARKAEQIARDALAELAREGTTGALDDRLDRVCARLACHAAVRAGDTMSHDSVRALLRDLDAIDLGAHCPHGRPVVRTLRYDEMALWFDRK